MIRFRKVPRSYTTDPGWRLATCDEAKHNLQMIEEQQLFKDRERARLLDGWISGPDPNFKIRVGEGYRGSMGHMLLIKNNMSENELYANLRLGRAKKEMALLLCAEDWNYEVVYWVLNSLAAETEAAHTDAHMDASDVREGKIPFPHSRFLKLNEMVNVFARTLGDSAVSEKTVNERISPSSIKEMLLRTWSCCWNKLDESYQKLLGRDCEVDIDRTAQSISESFREREWGYRVNEEVSLEAKNFAWEYLSSVIISKYAHLSLDLFFLEWSNSKGQELTTAQKNFLVSTRILSHIVYNYENFCSILRDRGNWFDNQQGVELLKRKLEDGSYWHVYDTENYSPLEKALFWSVRWESPIMMNKMLDYGTKPLSKLRGKTVLHYALKSKLSEAEVNDFAKRLFDKCNGSEKELLVNAVDEDTLSDGTALHMAASRGFARTCELLLNNGGRQDIKDGQRKIPLHCAVRNGRDEVVDVLVRTGKNDEAESQDTRDINQNRIDIVNLEDILWTAVLGENMKVVAKLLAISKQPVEKYFDSVDKGQLLRQLALEGTTDIVKKLLMSKAEPKPEPDEADEEGKTTLHYIAMCKDHDQALQIYHLIRNEIPEPELKNLVAMCDLKGRTALHLAAENENFNLCYTLLEANPEIQNKKDEDGQSPIYYAVKTNAEDYLVKAFVKKWRMIDGNLVDSTGLTPLHVAVTAGKIRWVDALLRSSIHPKSYLRKADFLGQTALHKACKEGHVDIIKRLLLLRAEPLLERDCDGRTALHYAVQIHNEEKGMEVVKLLLESFKSEEKKLLFLWASAAALGTADENLKKDSLLKDHLQTEKKKAKQNLTDAKKETNLTRIAASTGDIEMTKELLTRGGQISDIEDEGWRTHLKEEDEQPNVEKVLKQIQRIVEQGNDQPTMVDNLGRYDFTCGLAALFLNPCLKPPINVGISGKWGKGKSSLMKQTEIMLLKTRAQLVLRSSQSSTSDFPGAKNLELSKTGKNRKQEIERQIELSKDYERFKGNSFVTRMTKMLEGVFVARMKKMLEGVFITTTKEESNKKAEDSLSEFLYNYKIKYDNIFKSLAAMDASCMFTKSLEEEESVPAILTVQYNAWKYRNDKEALAGMAVEITGVMEKTMTLAQWMSTSWRYTWKTQKQDLWMKVIFPFILVVFLAGTFTCIVWLLLDRYKFNRSTELKYASLPVTILITVWTLVKSVMNTVNPVSTKLMNYIQFPNHAENLGYQEKVISDIKFLKEEVGRKPFLLCTIAAYIWDLVSAFCTLPFLSLESFGEPKVPRSVFNASVNPRIIVFVDDLDRCHESIILQVLSAINLVLAVCEISVIVGMDKALIERAIIKRYGDKNVKGDEKLADEYLQKIIQLPLDLPDPDQDQSKEFLERQLGVFGKRRHDQDDNALFPDEEDEFYLPKENEDFEFGKFDGNGIFPQNTKFVLLMKEFLTETSTPEESKLESRGETNTRENKDVAIQMDVPVIHSSEGGGVVGKGASNIDIEEGDQRSREIIPIQGMLFVRYSKGERDAFYYFQLLATDFRKLPREWKRLLNYHRLVWNIFSMSKEATQLDGWQVQLITWIFICWEWEENMNFLIKKWGTIDILKTSELDKPPSLKVIVADVIKNKRWLPKENISANSNKEDANKLSKMEKNIMSKKFGVEGAMKEKEVEEQDGMVDGMLKKVVKEMNELKEKFKEMNELKEKFKEIELELKDQGTKRKRRGQKSKKFAEMEQMEEQNWNRLKSTLDRYDARMDGIQGLLEEVLKETKELKDEGTKRKQTGHKSEKIVEMEQMKEQNWNRLKSTLDRYDVRMDGIQVFQNFRFYCNASHLPWPLPKEDFLEVL